MEPVTVAAVQASPAFLDREATIDKACDLVADAAAEGAGLVVFPEAFVPGYPDWVWRTKPWDDGEWYGRLLAQAVTVPSDATERLGEAARLAGTWVAIGISELDTASRTIFNSLLYLAPNGTVAGCHRKLMPTGGERTVWGAGDGSTLTVLDTPFGRLGGLLCWENYMPLARAAMYAQRIDVYLAPTWDNADSWLATLRHIAREGRVFVIGTNSCIRGTDVPSTLPGRDDIYSDDDWLSRGNTTIVGPDGDIIVGPLVESEGILYAEIDATIPHRARREFDPAGHYARPDVFSLHVDTRSKRPATFSPGGGERPRSPAGGARGTPLTFSTPPRVDAGDDVRAILTSPTQSSVRSSRVPSTDPADRITQSTLTNKEAPMAGMIKKSFDSPEEVRPFEQGSGQMQLVNLDGGPIGRATFQPGWQWSKHVKPIAGTDSCQAAHMGYFISGRMKIVMDDGEEAEFGPGDVMVCPPGHDAWIVGDEACVVIDWQGVANYAKRS